MSKLALNHLDAPCIFYNLNGYYDHMKALLDHMIEMELSTKERQKKIYFEYTLKKLQHFELENRTYAHFPFVIFNLDTVCLQFLQTFLHTLDMGFLYPVISKGTAS